MFTCNGGQPVDFSKGLWFEVGINGGEEIGTHSICKTANIKDAILIYHKTVLDPHETKFIDVWGISTDGLAYPLDLPAVIDSKESV